MPRVNGHVSLDKIWPPDICTPEIDGDSEKQMNKIQQNIQRTIHKAKYRLTLWSQQGENTLVFAPGHEPSCWPGMYLDVHVFIHSQTLLCISEIQSELPKLSVSKKCSESVSKSVFYSANCCVLTLSCCMHGKHIPFCNWNFLFEFVDAWFVFLLFGSSQFNLEFFPLGDLDKNVKTFLDIVKYRPAHTFVFVLPSAESGVWTSWSPNSTYLHLNFYPLSTYKYKRHSRAIYWCSSWCSNPCFTKSLSLSRP